MKSALANKLQRTMNIALGSALSTIGLTIPAVLAIGMISGKRVELGLEEPEIYLLLLTLLVSTVNLSSDRCGFLTVLTRLARRYQPLPTVSPTFR